MSLDPRHLIQLATIVETGSFAQAATQLDLAQSALSRNIKTLEERVGSPVLQRGRRGAVPTEIGTRLAQHGQVIRTAHLQANNTATSISSIKSDHLRIAATRFIGENVLIKPLAEFMAAHESVSCYLETGPIEELIELVTTGQADIAIGQFGSLAQSAELNVEPLIEDYLTVVARPSHPLARRSTLTPDVLAQLKWIMPQPHSRLRWEIETALKYLGISFIEVVYETPSVAAMLTLAQESDCVALVPRFGVSPLIARRQFVELLPKHRVEHRPIGILSKADKRKSAVANSFCRELRREAKRLMND